MQNLNMSTICRSCRASDHDLHSMFNSYANGEVTLQEMFVNCTQIEIGYNDQLPQNFCSKCVEDIKTCYEFRLRSQKSDFILKEHLSQKRLVGDTLLVKIEPLEDSFSSDYTPASRENYTVVMPIQSCKSESNGNESMQVDGEEDLLLKVQAELNSTINESSTEKNPNQCGLCNKVFTSHGQLARHLKTHLNDIHCLYCKKSFLRRAYSDYKDHMLAMHPGLTIMPPRKRTNNDELKAATLDILKETKKSAICQICGDSFTRIDSLRQHITKHTAANLKSIDFSNKPYLFEPHENIQNPIKYVLKKIKNQDIGRFYQITDPYGDEFSLSDADSDADDDKEGNRKILECILCNEHFPRIKDVLKHSKDQHTPDQLHCCSYCNKGFVNSELLARHLRHQCENKEKKFICSFCDTKFMWQTSLNKHALVHHINTKVIRQKSKIPFRYDNGRYTCTTCNKSFTRLEHLKRHSNVHTMEKKFECSTCNKRFSRKDGMVLHLKTHAKAANKPPSKIMRCKICKKRFTSLKNFRSHSYQHKIEKD